MPSSNIQGKVFFQEWVSFFMANGQIGSALDVGAGSGGYGKLIRRVIPQTKRWNKSLDEFVLHACEPFKPYHNRYQLQDIYDMVYPELIQDKLKDMQDYDLIIFGDVLEHLERGLAVDVFRRSKEKAKFIWLCLPILRLRSWSNPYDSRRNKARENILEKHLHDWSYGEVLTYLGPFLWQVPYPIVGVFIAEGGLFYGKSEI